MNMIKVGDKAILKRSYSYMEAGTIFNVDEVRNGVITLTTEMECAIDFPWLPKSAKVGCKCGVDFEGFNEYFELVEDKPKRQFGKWTKFNIKEYLPLWWLGCEALRFFETYEYRTDGKRVQVRGGDTFILNNLMKSTASCMDSDEFDVERGISLASLRLMKKLIDDDIEVYTVD